MIISGTHKAAWQCGESATGLPSCQEHLLGASGRIHSSSLASLSSGGSFSRLPLPKCAPERWGHPADLQGVSAGDVSKGMVGPAKGKGRRSCQFSLFPDSCRRACFTAPIWRLLLTRPPLGVGLLSLKKLDKKRHNYASTAAVQNNWALSPKVTRTATVCPSYPTPTHLPQHGDRCLSTALITALFTTAKTWKQTKCPSVGERITKCGLSTQWNCIRSQKWNEVLILNI